MHIILSCFSKSWVLICGLYFTYLLIPWCRILLEKASGLQLVKKFLALHVTRRFITALTSVRHQASHMWVFLNISVLQGGVVSTSPNPQVVCPRLLIQFIRSYPPYRRPFLYPQPEDAPYRITCTLNNVTRTVRLLNSISWLVVTLYGHARHKGRDHVDSGQ